MVFLFFFVFHFSKERIPVYILIIVYFVSDRSLWRKSQNNKILFKQGKTRVTEKSIYALFSHRCMLVNSLKYVNTCCLVLNDFPFPLLIAIFLYCQSIWRPSPDWELRSSFCSHKELTFDGFIFISKYLFRYIYYSDDAILWIYSYDYCGQMVEDQFSRFCCFNKLHALINRKLSQTFTYQFSIGFLCPCNRNSSHLNFRCAEYLY